MGTRISDPVLLELPAPQKIENVWSGEVIHIDHFGNISTNIRREHLGAPGTISVHLGGAEIPGLFKTFGERPAGDLMALYGSTGNLIVSEVNGSAAGRLGVKVGDPVQVTIQ
jgi:S-adenosylmethionine hydrolase